MANRLNVTWKNAAWSGAGIAARQIGKQVAFQFCIDHLEAFFPAIDIIPGHLKISLCIAFINTPEMIAKIIHWQQTGNWGGRKTAMAAVVAAIGTYIHPLMYVTTKSLTGTTATLAIESRTGLFTKMMGLLGRGGLTREKLQKAVRPELYSQLNRKLAAVAAHYQLQTGMDPQAKLNQIKTLGSVVAYATGRRLGRVGAQAAALFGSTSFTNTLSKLNTEIAELIGPAAGATGGNYKNLKQVMMQYATKQGPNRPGTLALPNGRQTTMRQLPANSFNLKGYTTKIGRTKLKELERMNNTKLKNFAFPRTARRSQNNINKAFREFSRKFHPNKAPTAEKPRFEKVFARASAMKNSVNVKK